MYYSIPGVREAELSLREVDHSEVVQTAHSVTRNTRISFEQHSSLVMEAILDDEDDEVEFSGDILDLVTELSNVQ